MKDKTIIERVKIDHYGPLEIDVELEEGLNVFHGLNESGKTLFVEAVTSMLTGENGRLDQRPEGFMTVSNGGEELNASQEGLEHVLEGVSPEDVREAFVIRDGDLRRPEMDNSFGRHDYFRDVTDRVLGSRTTKIEAIRDELADIGFLTNSTSDGKLENTKNSGKLGDARDEAIGLIDDINDFLDSLEGEGLYSKFRELNRLENSIKEQEELVTKLENAEKQEKYRKGLEIIEELECLDDKRKALRKEENDVSELEELKRAAEEFEASGKAPDRWSKAALISGLSSAAPAVISLFAQGIVQILMAIAALIGVAATIYFIYRYVEASGELSETEAERDDLIDEAEAKGLSASSLHDVVEKIESYSREVETEIDEVEQERQNLLQDLSAIFGENRKGLQEWREFINEYSESFEAVDEDFDQGLEEAEEELQEMKNRIDEIEDEIRSKKRKVEGLGKEFSNTVDERFLEEPVEVNSIEDLSRARDQLEQFVSNLDENVEASREAIAILEEMEQDEGDEFNRLFDDSYAVQMFSEATEGNYTDIRYVKEENRLEVERADGRNVTPDQLSQGTYDLLYMSIRLGLAQEILDRPGFLILDSAFTHSDVERIEKEVEFLQKLEEKGWQIIYLTYREDTKKVFEEYTDVKGLDRFDYSS